MLGFKKKLYNVAVIGENGMLGKEVCDWLRSESRLAHSCIGNVWTISKKDVDFSKPTWETLKYFCNKNVLNVPDVVINCAAYTDTKAIESTIEGRNKSYKENVILPMTLAKACAAAKIKLIHISTDYVGSEYSDKADFPANMYGLHKLLAEQYIEKTYAKAKSNNYLILRTSWLFGPNGSHKTFIEKFMVNMYKAIAKATLEKKETIDVSVASNTCGYPTSTWFLSSFIRNAIEAKLIGNTFAYQPTSLNKGRFPTIDAVSRLDWATVIAAVVCKNRDFRNLNLVANEVPAPTALGEVHHPQCLPQQYITLHDIAANRMTSIDGYQACINESSTWKLHTMYFIEGAENRFDDLEKWVLSNLTDEEKAAIKTYPRIDVSPTKE